MSTNKLQRKFLRSEIKSGRDSSAEDASEAIRQIKALKKSTELPPPLPAEALSGDFELMIEEVSRTLKIDFSSIQFTDESSLFSKSVLTVDLLHALIKTLSLQNTHGVFKGKENIFYCDVLAKDIWVYLSMELSKETSAFSNDYIQAVLSKTAAQLRPYGSSCKIQFVEDLLRHKKFMTFIFNLNRLENFSSKEGSEEVERKSVEGNMHA